MTSDDRAGRTIAVIGAAAIGLARRPQILIAAAVIALALLIRYRVVGYVSRDYTLFLKPWADFITDHGGFGALRYGFADYNVPYLYLLVVVAYVPEYLPVTLLTTIKVVSVLFDGVLAFFVYRIVALRYASWRVPLLAALVVFVLPTVIANSAVWGQCDSIYSAFGVAGLYYLLRDRPWLGCALFGVAYAFKQQAVFLFPVLLVLVLTRKVPWKALVAVPATYLLLDVPAWLAGRPIGELLTIYLDQTSRYGGLVLNAPSVWVLVDVPPNAQDLARQAGILFTAVVFLILTYVVVAGRLAMTTERVVLFAAASTIIAPFLLPGMHERYFYLADVLTVVAAFVVPHRLWYVPVLVQIASFQAYLPFMFDIPGPPLDFRILTGFVLAAGVATTYELLRPDPATAEPVSDEQVADEETARVGHARKPTSASSPPAVGGNRRERVTGSGTGRR